MLDIEVPRACCTNEISELLSRNLTGQRPEAILRRTILGTDGNMLTINTIQNLRDMHSGGKHRNLDIRRQNLHPERLDKLWINVTIRIGRFIE